MSVHTHKTDHIAQLATILGLPISIIGLYLGYVQVLNSRPIDKPISSTNTPVPKSVAIPSTKSGMAKRSHSVEELEEVLQKCLTELEEKIVHLKERQAIISRDVETERNLSLLCDLGGQIRAILNDIDSNQKQVELLRLTIADCESRLLVVRRDAKVPQSTIVKLESELLKAKNAVHDIDERLATELKAGEAILVRIRMLW